MLAFEGEQDLWDFGRLQISSHLRLRQQASLCYMVNLDWGGLLLGWAVCVLLWWLCKMGFLDDGLDWQNYKLEWLVYDMESCGANS